MKKVQKSLPPEEIPVLSEMSENDAERQTAFSQQQFRRAKAEKQEQKHRLEDERMTCVEEQRDDVHEQGTKSRIEEKASLRRNEHKSKCRGRSRMHRENFKSVSRSQKVSKRETSYKQASVTGRRKWNEVPDQR